MWRSPIECDLGAASRLLRTTRPLTCPRPDCSGRALSPAAGLDISAFAGALNDGHAHTFEFTVVGGDPKVAQGDTAILAETE